MTRIEFEADLLKDEKIEAILEYSPNKIVISLYPNDYFIVKNWEVVSAITKN